jgi:Glyoxalase-like domain
LEVFWQLTIDANDPERLARFWGAALGYVPVPPTSPPTPWNDHYRARLQGESAFTDRLFDPDGLRPPLWFQAVPEHKSGKNRLHLDMYPTGRDRSLAQEQRVAIVDARVAELIVLGASIERTARDDDPADPFYWVVLHDPEGNEFCVGS